MTDRVSSSGHLLKHAPLIAILALQSLCAIYLVRDMVLSVLGIYYEPLAWEYLEYLDIGAALGLIAGIALGGHMLVQSLRQRQRAEEKLRRARTAFADLALERFADWGLSPAEREVALFSIKGLSVAEIAGLRGTSEGTIKAQAVAVYRKAGVANRHQLLSLFIEDMFDPDLMPAAVSAPDRAAISAAAPEHS
ncbi:helix-turn-helix transcriptional regulator [uncultured Paracoccus sp.]|uniref:helix-turn-helix transcriptional regulator n=1 Tax=uncultured Paracoccus sp. TaxID=189685 RepID=UPI002604AAE2|nr:helix-turn-helix transcriptional regulator [uncultured Paracoccus sp.]